MSGLVVRHALPDDTEAYCDLYEQVAAERLWIGREPPVDRDAIASRLDDAQAGPSRLSIVADTDGTLVGLLDGEIGHGIASLGMLVAAGWRGRGVGTALVERLLDWSRERRAHKVTLQVWPHNTGAIRLYERHGFVVEGRLRRHYRRRSGELWDALIMGLVLDEDSPGRQP